MIAEITYNVGATYRIKQFVFKNGVTQTIQDEEVIRHLGNTAGFAVRVLEASKKKKKIIKAAAKPMASEVKEEVVIESAKKVREVASDSITSKKKRKG